MHRIRRRAKRSHTDLAGQETSTARNLNRQGGVTPFFVPQFFSSLYQEKDSQQTPTVFTKDGFRFFFYSNDHIPIHVHVRGGSGEAVFEVEREVILRESMGLKTSELVRAEELARQHRKLIIQKWHEFFD